MEAIGSDVELKASVVSLADLEGADSSLRPDCFLPPWMLKSKVSYSIYKDCHHV